MLLYNRGSQVLISLLFASSLFIYPPRCLCSFQSFENLSVESGGSGPEKNDPPGRRNRCDTQTQLGRRPENASLHALAETNDGTPLYCGPSGGFSQGRLHLFVQKTWTRRCSSRIAGWSQPCCTPRPGPSTPKNCWRGWRSASVSVRYSKRGQIFRETESNTSV